MQITVGIAQNIVNEMMDVIPYNVNVMNEKGIIVASGDINRIGIIHTGALKAIKKKKLLKFLLVTN